jgi:Glycosyl transferase family 2
MPAWKYVAPKLGRPFLLFPFMMYGVLSCCLGFFAYLLGVAMFFPRYLLGLNSALLPLTEWLVWYSGVPVTFGIALIGFDLLFLFPYKRLTSEFRFDPVSDQNLTVALTAYNDEASIYSAVKDFSAHPAVKRIIVISNNSTDKTMALATEAGATALNEPEQGYGHCVYRCIETAIQFTDTSLVLICEGDRTFRAYDIDKLLAFLPHADIVNGTRTVEKLRQFDTQLSTFMYFGNIFVGKILELKHLGRSTITDVGATYKLCRREALVDLLPTLDPNVNLEFNAHFLDRALSHGLFLVECPITFHARVGESKGGNKNDLAALRVGCRMLLGIVMSWRLVK